MKIKIYQINSERDEKNALFLEFESLEKFTGSPNVNSSIYDKIYEGDVDCKDLERVYVKFNEDRPPEFTGHSLSKSDVVEVIDSPKLVGVIDRADNLKISYTDFLEYTQAQEFLRENGVDFEAHDYVGLNVPSVEPGFYFCDSFGFKKIDFDPAQTQEKVGQKIKVVMVEPEKEARIVDLFGDLRAMQHAVRGDIEQMCPFDEQVAIICNGEGKIHGLPLNRAVYMEGDNSFNPQMVDIIAGTFFICAIPPESEHYESLSDEQAKRYLDLFKAPEKFYRVGDQIAAIKQMPKLDKVIAEANAERGTSQAERTLKSRGQVDRDI